MGNIFKGFLQGLGCLGCLGCLILLLIVLSLSPVIALFLGFWGVFEVLLISYVMSLWIDQEPDAPTNSDIVGKKQDTSPS